MTDIKLEAVTIDDEYEYTKEDAQELIEQFLEETGDHVTAEYTEVQDEDGEVLDRRIRTYSRHSEIWWTSIAILLISNPEGVIQFLKFVKDIPGLTMGFTVKGDIWIKMYTNIDFTLIDNSTNYNVQKIGEVDGDVIAKIPE